MNVLQVNTSDRQGGADRVAVQLLHGLPRVIPQLHRDDLRLLVHDRQSNDPGVVSIPASRDGRPGKDRMVRLANRMKASRGLWRAGNALYTFAGGTRQKMREQGLEIFDYPESRDLLAYAGGNVDLVHAHNLHGHYFDLHYLTELSKQVPVLITLHDEWMYTGHCVYSLDCNRWKTGCGDCPYLDTPHALEADGTAANWKVKKTVYENSRLHIATPSEWLKDRVGESMMQTESLQCIPNGVDLNTFKPAKRRDARAELDLPVDGLLVLCVANQRNPFKDFKTLEEAARLLKLNEPVTFVSVGATEEADRELGPHRWIQRGFVSEMDQLARYYQASDLFAFATQADNYPLVTLEALACGCPVVASDIGGLPEQIDASRGRLVPAQNPAAMAEAIREILSDPAKRDELGWNARRWAEAHAGEDQMIHHYFELYERIAS